MIPVARPYLGEKEETLVLQALRKTEISGTGGEFIPRFESEFSKFVDCSYGIAVSNGTHALHLAVAALGIGPGDEVLVATFTNMASIFSIKYTGATPIAIDIEPDTWNINPELLEKKITPKTKAIMVVHIYGHPVDMDPVLDIAKRHNLFVIEDAAEAHGAKYKGRKIGSLGDIGCFSFYANKIITTGEGGMIVTNSKEIADKVRGLGTLSYGPRENRFMHSAVGFNYRMSNLIAALGCAQLEKIEEVINLKRSLADFYIKELSGIKNLQLPVEKNYAKNVYWMFHVVLKDSLRGKRKEILDRLREEGIETRVAFTPYNRQEIFIKEGLVRPDECPVANNVGENGFYIPSGPILSAEEKKQVTSSLNKICGTS